MNRLEFQQWLDQFPEETIIEVAVQDEPPLYHAYGECVFREFIGDVYIDYDYTDFTNNKFVKPSASYYNKKILQLGAST